REHRGECSEQTADAEGITNEEVIPAVSDVLSSLALIMTGEVEARAAITRIEGRIEDWKVGSSSSGGPGARSMVCRPQDECSPGTRLNGTYLPVEKPSTARWSPMVVTTIVVPRRTNAQHWVSTSH